MSKLQETTMTTPEQLKEEWKESNESDGLSKEVRNEIADFWLNKIQSLLREIEGRMTPLIDEIGTGAFSRDQLEHANNTIETAKEIGKEVLSIIQEYKGKKI